MFRTFEQMVDVISVNSPHGLVLDWWQRVERALMYYTIAFHAKECHRTIAAIDLIALDMRLSTGVIQELHDLRRFRNNVAHNPRLVLTATDAAQFATRALSAIDEVTKWVPDQLAMESGAARVA